MAVLCAGTSILTTRPDPLYAAYTQTIPVPEYPYRTYGNRRVCLMGMLRRISFLTENWRNDENWPSWRKYSFLTKFDEIGELRDLWQHFWRNLHFLANEKWHFWRQNLAKI